MSSFTCILYSAPLFLLLCWTTPLPFSRLSKLFFFCKIGDMLERPGLTLGLSLLYPESRRAAGFLKRSIDVTIVPSVVCIQKKVGQTAIGVLIWAWIVPTTADLSSTFNLQCLFEHLFFFYFLCFYELPKPECIFYCQVLWSGVFYTFDMNLTQVYNNF